MFAKDYRRLAWQALSGHWGPMVVIYLVYALLIGVLSYTGIGSLLFSGVLMIGVASTALSLLRTSDTRVEYLFDGFKGDLTNALIASILYNVFISLWSLLFVIPGIVKTYSYAMTFYILRDNPNMPANDAITASRKMMDGNKFRLFCLHFSFIGWIILSAFTAGILLLWVIPYMQTAQAAFYEDLCAKQKAEQASADYFGEN